MLEHMIILYRLKSQMYNSMCFNISFLLLIGIFLDHLMPLIKNSNSILDGSTLSFPSVDNLGFEIVLLLVFLLGEECHCYTWVCNWPLVGILLSFDSLNECSKEPYCQFYGAPSLKDSETGTGKSSLLLNAPQLIGQALNQDLGVLAVLFFCHFCPMVS